LSEPEPYIGCSALEEEEEEEEEEEDSNQFNSDSLLIGHC
jgi:hypothetical protein